MYKWWQRVSRFEEAPTGEGAPGSGGDASPLPEPSSKQGDPDLQAMAARLKNLEKVIERQPVQPQQVPQQQVPGQPTKEDLERQFFKDPLGFLQQFGNVVSQQVMQSQAPALIQAAKDKVRNQDPELWDALEMHIMAKMSDVPLEYQTNPTVWANAINLVKGEHLDEVLKLKGKKQVPASNDGPVPANHRPSPAPKTPELSAEEQTFIRKMRLTPEKYLQGKEFYNDQEKMWNQVVTFDSESSRRSVDAK